MEDVKVKLKHAIELQGGKTIDEVTMRCPLVEDIIRSENKAPPDGSPTAGDAALLAEISNIDMAAVRKLRAPDFRHILAKGIAAGFFGDGMPKASAKPSSP